MAHRILRDKTAQAVVTTTLVTWRHALGRDAFCLARLVRPFAGTTAAVVLSEVAENPDALGIAADFPSAATAAWAVLGGPAAEVDLTRLAWFAHHGPFSSYDPAGPETLTEVTLSFDGARFEGDLIGHRLLEPEPADKLLWSWRLEPVDEALARLGRV
ncbi:hypothetical protein NLX86_33790 [Streptomyces sp. A3M-1-3]|uniref:hypothetical protein n=1 Tax=Streptomyces sp. A3M-1-3 TaxID=2962044 RepID=UPI0020B703E0|nr:hypothetical protein [Streptomyces sp. A3M-1-3]MCP3822869.1 hypothetical protein [Streptomyces sp. A3M-1-3]